MNKETTIAHVMLAVLAGHTERIIYKKLVILFLHSEINKYMFSYFVFFICIH